MRESPGDDKDLVERLQASDPAAFEALVRAYQHRVFGVAVRMLGNRTDAEDVAQEVFLRVHRAIGSFRGEAKLSTWLYGIASNLCLNRLASADHRRVRHDAGAVNRAQEPRRLARMMDVAASPTASGETRKEFVSEGFFEYHLYTLDGRTTIKDNQTKQLALMSASDVPIRKHLVYYGAQEYYRTQYGVPVSSQKVAVLLELRNSKENRLGVPLPKGKLRVYKADASGSTQFIGEDWIDHTPKDERVKIKVGNAFDVGGERTQKEFRKIAGNTWEVEWEISLRNHKKEDQTVTVIEPLPGDWQVLNATHTYEKPEAHTLTFEIPVPKEGAAKLTYRVRIRY